MNIFQFKTVIFSFVISLILIVSLLLIIQQQSSIHIQFHKQYYQRKDIRNNTLPGLSANVKKRQYLLHTTYTRFQNYIDELIRIGGESQKDLNLINRENHSVFNVLSFWPNKMILTASLWGIDSLDCIDSIRSNIIEEKRIIASVETIEAGFQKFLNEQEKRNFGYDIMQLSHFSMEKNSRLRDLNLQIQKLIHVNERMIQLFGDYNQLTGFAQIRLFTIVTVLLFIIILILLLFSVRYFMQPLILMDNATRKIVNQRTSLKEIHIPYLGNNYYGRLGLAIRKMITYLSEIDMVKGNILSQVTHDLKSPLATIGQGIEILEDDSFGKMGPKQKEVLNLMKSGHNTMNKLIDNLVNAAKIEYDSYKMNFVKFDLVPLFFEVMQSNSLLLKKKNIKIYFNRKRWKQFVVKADPKGMEDVLRNLIGNAIKFTPENGEIYVELDLKNYDVYVKIKDSGIGIPEQDLDKIFEKLYRAKNSRKISVKGTGLGLFIVKNIVQRHNGEITVHSELGKGTVFEIHFPRFQTTREMIEIDEETQETK